MRLRATETFCWLPPDRNSTAARATASGSPAVRRGRRRRAARPPASRKPSTEKWRNDWIVAFTLTPSTASAPRLRHRQQHDPDCNRLVGRDQRQLLAVADDPSRLRRWRPARTDRRAGAARCLRRRRSPRSRRLQGEADRPERLALKAVDHEHRTPSASGAVAARQPEGAADDQLDELRLVVAFASTKLPGLPSRRTVMRSAISRTSGRRGSRPPPDATEPCRRDRPVQRFDLVRSQGRGRLVEQQHLRVRHQRLGHLEELAVGQVRKPPERPEQLEVEVELGQPLARPLLPLPNRRSPVLGRRQERLFFTGSGRISEVSW